MKLPPPLRRSQLRRNAQLQRQPLFGRGPGGGKDSHSRQWRLSMAVFLNRNKRPLAAPIEVAEPFSERPPPSQYAKRWQVAAALSAAVTTTKLIGDAPNSQAEPTKKKAAPQTLAALRERGSGGEGKDSHSRQWRLSMAVFLNRNKRSQAAPIEVAELLSEKPPLPPEFPRLTPVSHKTALCCLE